MKVELTDVSETKKTLTVEVPPEVVDTEITRVTQGYARQARIPGFRPGKAPAHVVRKRFREQILHDVAHDLVPRVVGDALRDKNVQPVDTPKVRDLQLEEGKPLTFTAAIETAPHVEPGDLATLTVQRPRCRCPRMTSTRRCRGCAIAWPRWSRSRTVGLNRATRSSCTYRDAG